MDKRDLIKAESLLATLRLSELNSLVMTVTKSLVKEEFPTKEEAISTIIRHSSDIQSILKRKIVTRQVIFNFLDKYKVNLYPPHTKDNLIESFLSFNPENLNSLTDQIAQNESLQTLNPNTTHISTNKAPTPNINEMAFKFSEWFYKMFNQDHPLETSHFWQDCNFKLNLKSAESVQSELVQGNAQETVNLLFKTKMQHGILLNPNLLAEGCQGRMDLHGVVVVLACGTIHQGASCVGVFEQVFALVRDPMLDNNWKIKYSELNLRSQLNSTVPRLTDSELTNSLLELSER